MPKKKKHPKRHRPKLHNAPVQSNAIVRIAPAPEKPWQLDQKEITIVKNSIAKGASDVELEFCLTVARRYRLDPFRQQIWFVKRWDSNADNGAGGRGANVWTPQVGINGLLFAAARDHKTEFGAISKPEYGPIVNGHPEWASVKVTKKNGSITEAEAWWEEYAPADLTKAPFWRKMPRRMIGKCATALAIREAYPDLGGLYIPEECERMNQEFAQDVTPEGRRILIDGKSPSGTYTSPERRYQDAKAAQGVVAEAKAKGIWCERHQCPFPQCPADEHSDGEMEMMEAAERAAKARPAEAQVMPQGQGNGQDARNVTPKPSQSTPPARPAQARPVSQGATHQPPTAVPEAELGGIWPKRPKKDSGKQEDAPEARKAGKGSVLGGSTPSGPTLLCGTLHNAVIGQAKNQAPYVNAKINQAWYYCWTPALHDFLLGKRYPLVVEVWLDKRSQIVGLKRINDLHFDEDGRTPIVQRSEQQPGQRTLY
jgi:hypothetical protein